MTVDEETLNRAFTALGDPARRAIVARLSFEYEGAPGEVCLETKLDELLAKEV